MSAAAFRSGVAAVFKRLRRTYGRRVEYFGMVEFTTGDGTRAAGRRRIHQHVLLKGLPEAIDVIAVEKAVRETWQASTGATRVEVAQLRAPGGALGYLALHHRKPRQAPPKGWRGMVERHSLGYFHRPIAELRQDARQQLQAEAIAWSKGIPPEVAEFEVIVARWDTKLVAEYPDRNVIVPLSDVEIAPPPSQSDWIMRQGRFVHRLSGELWEQNGTRSTVAE